MTMTAKYAGKCSKCGGQIRPGERINFDATTHTTQHVQCPERTAIAPAQTASPAPYHISGGEGYGYRGWQVGQVIRASDRMQAEQGYPEWLYVVHATSRYYREDGMSFGVGDESGHTFAADCRAATDDESAPIVAQRRARAERKTAEARRAEIARMFETRGERPDGPIDLDGQRLMDTQTIYGGGDWFELAAGAMWYIQNNGADGDDWSTNNIRTGGAGAIGWRLPLDLEIEAELLALDALLSSQ